MDEPKLVMLAEVSTYEHRIQEILKTIREHISRMEVKMYSVDPEIAMKELLQDAKDAQEYTIKFYVVLGQMNEGLDSGTDFVSSINLPIKIESDKPS